MSGACVAESDHPYSFKSLYEAYLSCRRRKRNTINTLRFEASLLDNLIDLREALTGGGYTPSRSVCFIAKQPKLREIFAADFRDRVVHHLLVPRIEAIFEPKFIHDSYACRKGRGTHAAVARLREFMNRVTKRGRVAAWFMQLDIRSFFMSMDRRILLNILARHIRDPRLLELAEIIVRNDCTRDYVYKGDPRLLDGIPAHKSLFHIPPGKGLPIGNLTSQFFGNVYLNELDQFVKHELKAKFYLRYVDDFVLLHTNRETLLDYRVRIAAFLAERLALELKPDMTLKRVSEGADFLGYIVRPDYVLVRSRVVGNLRARLRSFRDELVAREDSDCLHLHLHEEPVQRLRQTLASYLGHFKHANAHRLTRCLFAKYPYLKELFTLAASDCEPPVYPSPDASRHPLPRRGEGFPLVDISANLHRNSPVFLPPLQGEGRVGDGVRHRNSASYRKSPHPPPDLPLEGGGTKSPKLAVMPMVGMTHPERGPRVDLRGRRRRDDERIVPKIQPLYEPLSAPSCLKDQYEWAARCYAGYCVFFQVGRFCEFYGEQAERHGRFFGLEIRPTGRLKRVQCGFPLRCLKGFKKRAYRAGRSYVVIGERGYYASGLKKRVVTELCRFERSAS